MKIQILGIILFFITCLVYLPSTQCGYIWDNDRYIQGNPTLESIEGLDLIWWPFNKARVYPMTVQYYPLTYTSFWFESWFWKKDPFGYHLTNILLHALGSILLWRILDYLRIPGAWLVAAVFAIPPVHVESVSWVTERKNVLSGVFYLASMLTYLKFSLETPSRKRYVASLILFIAALLSKSVTCSLPAALILIIWWQKKKLTFKVLRPLIPFFILGMFLGILTAWMEENKAGAMGPEWQLSFVERFLLAGRAACFYAGKLLWPTNLAFIYPRWQVDEAVWWQYLFPLIVLTGLFILWKNRLGWGRGPLVAVLFFIGTLFPALGFFNVFPFRYSFVADHFQYLASIGVITLVVSGLYQLIWVRGNAPLKKVSPSISLAILVVLGTLTWKQQKTYQDMETLWRETIQVNPRAWMAHHNLALILRAHENHEEAINHFYKALIENPNLLEAHNSLADSLRAIEKFSLAEVHYQQSLELDPQSTKAHNNLAMIYRLQKKNDKAIFHLKKILTMKPKFVHIHYMLALVLMQEGDDQEALSHLKTVMTLAPESHWSAKVQGLIAEIKGL